MDWNETLREREVIESCRRSYYEDYEDDDDEEEDYEDEADEEEGVAE